ncbi:MAG: zinc-dependent metalloprotease [Candidatus Dormibacteraeota bacterium]|nr:zinc-dependent metalloprotease [Candidatus Dormibacteraeota bacterium]
MTSRIVQGVLAGAAIGAAAVAITELNRPLGGETELLDWTEVDELARARLGETRVPADDLARAGEELNRLAAEVTPRLLEAVGGLPEGRQLARFEALDRVQWLERNVASMRSMVDPLLKANRMPRTRLTEAGKAGIDRYLAFLLDLLARRVLGQFDPQLGATRAAAPGTESLYLVEQNVAAWQAEAKVDGGDLRRWLILHELTHAWQFAAHPWLRDHLNHALEALLDSVGARGGPMTMDRLLRLTVGAPEQWAVIRQVQATMTLVEGYGNLLMNLVGRRILPTFDQLEAAYEERSGSRSLVDLLVWRFTGLEVKMQQYKVGEAFCERIHDLYGMETLNAAWAGPENLPRPGELRDPDRWYRRVMGPRFRLVGSTGQ